MSFFFVCLVFGVCSTSWTCGFTGSIIWGRFGPLCLHALSLLRPVPQGLQGEMRLARFPCLSPLFPLPRLQVHTPSFFLCVYCTQGALSSRDVSLLFVSPTPSLAHSAFPAPLGATAPQPLLTLSPASVLSHRIDFLLIMGPIVLLLCQPGNFRLGARHCRFHHVLS